MVPGDVVRRRLHNHVSFFQPEKSPPSRTFCTICTTQWATVLAPNSTQTVESASLMTWSSRWNRAESEASGNLPINSSMQVDTFIKKQLFQSCYEDHHAIKMLVSAVKLDILTRLLAVGAFLKWSLMELWFFLASFLSSRGFLLSFTYSLCQQPHKQEQEWPALLAVPHIFVSASRWH